jgi:hypothetical protein
MLSIGGKSALTPRIPSSRLGVLEMTGRGLTLIGVAWKVGMVGVGLIISGERLVAENIASASSGERGTGLFAVFGTPLLLVNWTS